MAQFETSAGVISGTTYAGEIFLNLYAGIRMCGTPVGSRWYLFTSGTETGANAGTDLFLDRYDDSGTFLGTSLEIKRSTGEVLIQSDLNVGGSVVIVGDTPATTAGEIGFGKTTSATATAGSNGSVPSQVAGYLIISVSGTEFKVPYFPV